MINSEPVVSFGVSQPYRRNLGGRKFDAFSILERPFPKLILSAITKSDLERLNTCRPGIADAEGAERHECADNPEPSA